MYALELAARGAEVTAIEGREANIEKARFAARVLGLENVDFQLGDVRELSLERHGSFDVVLCLGILYHLDAPDAFRFVEQVGEVCRSLAVVDTWVALTPEETRSHDGVDYRGVSLFEHEEDASEAARSERLWSSLDNPRAFAPTLPSLLRLLDSAGFTSALECHLPTEGDKPEGRVTLVAAKGQGERPRLTPEPATSFPAEPERARARRLQSLVARVRSLARRTSRRPLRRL
jgi:SAM-dependent methyltransferase